MEQSTLPSISIDEAGNDRDSVATEDSEEGNFIHKVLAIALSVFVIYSILMTKFNLYQRLATFILLALVYLFLRYPLIDSFDRSFTGLVRWGLYTIDRLFILASIASFGYLVLNSTEMIEQAGIITQQEVILGFVAVFLVLEGTRRTINLFLPVFTFGFIVYSYLGPLLPGVFSHPGFTTRQLMIHIYTTSRGLFSFPTAVMFDYVFLFVLFGALLEYSGGAKFFLDLAMVLLGKVTGGPAKLAVVSSGIMGMLSGSSVANVLTTGAVTIPLMKKQGYDSEFAGGVESASSTGGQLMPPIMGAAVFIMVEITGINYSYIIVHALVPAVLYFVCIYLVVHFQSIKSGHTGLPPEMIPEKRTVLRRMYYFVPLVALIYLILENFSIQRSIIYSLGILFVVTMISPQSRLIDPRREKETVLSNPLVNGIERSAYRAVPIISAAACVGIVIGIVGLTGIGLKLSSFILSLGGSNLFIILILTMILSIIFGMAMDTVSVYVIVAIVIAPILIQAGVETFSAHLFIFYYGLMAMVTPPVCIAAYAAASLAEGNPMKTGFWAWRIALTAFILPFTFIYHPELLLIGSTNDIAIAIISATVGIVALAGAIVGYLYTKLHFVEQIVLFVSSLLLIAGGTSLSIVGFLAFAIGSFRNSRYIYQNGIGSIVERDFK